MSDAPTSALRNFLQDELGLEPGFTDDTPLFSGGLIDSFDLIRVLDHVSNALGVTISPLEVNLDNFDSLAKMADFVASRQ